MRKYLLLLLAVFFFGWSANAQQGRGDFLDLSVVYYNHGSKTGHLIFYNNSGGTISKAHVLVSVFITEYEYVNVPYLGNVKRAKTKTLILCDDDFYNIPKGESKETSSGRGIVKGGPEKEGKKYEYTVEVSYEVPFPGSESSSGSSQSSSTTANGQLVMSGEVLHAMYKSMDDPAPSRITVDVYRTSSGKYYANKTSPSSVANMEIFKLSGSVYNGYVRYMNNSYGILINDNRW